jgi:hypothetical protein
MAKGKRINQTDSMGSKESMQIPGRSEIMEDINRRLGEVLWKQMCLPASNNVIATLVIGETYHHLLEIKLVAGARV